MNWKSGGGNVSTVKNKEMNLNISMIVGILACLYACLFWHSSEKGALYSDRKDFLSFGADSFLLE